LVWNQKEMREDRSQVKAAPPGLHDGQRADQKMTRYLLLHFPKPFINIATAKNLF
jgi:hypothetical protein